MQHLQQYGQKPDGVCQNTLSHKRHKTNFCLCVDNFSVTFFNDNDREHLINNALKAKYEITVKHQYDPHEWSVPIYGNKKANFLNQLIIHHSWTQKGKQESKVLLVHFDIMDK